MAEHNSNEVMNQIWKAVLEALENDVSKPMFDQYLKDAHPLSLQDGILTVGVSSEVVKEFLQRRFSHTMEDAATQAAQQMVQLRFEIVGREQTSVAPPKEPAPAVEAPVEPQIDQSLRDEFSSTPLNKKYTFENFVVGRSNHFSHAAAVAVANNPARKYNPLFIYGGVGLGKTHLMQAIGHTVVGHSPSAEVVYISAETFLYHVVTAIREDRMAAFRRRYRNVDIWLVDDIQYLAERHAERTEVEFFHVFNALYDTNKQIVICSDRPPKELHSIEERLRSRLEWSMITDIKPPDYEHRIAILQKRIQDEGVNVPQGVLEFIAERIETNIRVLEGALTRVLATASLNNSLVTLEMAIESLEHYRVGDAEATKVSVEAVQQATAEQFQVSLEELTGDRRAKEIVRPRQIGMYLAKEMTGSSFPDIGRAFGRDHSTVMHSCEKIENELKSDPDLRRIVSEIRTKAIIVHDRLLDQGG